MALLFRRQIYLSSALLFFFKLTIGKKFICKLIDKMSHSVDTDETANSELSHLYLRCLQTPIIIACGSETVNGKLSNAKFITYVRL